MLLDQVKTIEPRSWSEVLKIAEKKFLNRGWIYRGQRDAQWPLASSLERAALEFDIPLDQLPGIEEDFVTRFYRNAHLYISNPFDEAHVLETLSLMQHHGAPTRLLDCSHSFFVAAFFALEAKPGPAGSAVWAIDYHWLRSWVQNTIRNKELLIQDPEVRKPDTFRSLFMSTPPYSFAYQLGPTG